MEGEILAESKELEDHLGEDLQSLLDIFCHEGYSFLVTRRCVITGASTTLPFVTATEYRSVAFQGSLSHCTASPDSWILFFFLW